MITEQNLDIPRLQRFQILIPQSLYNYQTDHLLKRKLKLYVCGKFDDVTNILNYFEKDTTKWILYLN